MTQLFYTEKIENGFAHLNEEESQHLLKVLRRRAGDRLQITDGQGFIYEAEIAEAGKKSAVAKILEKKQQPDQRPLRLHLAIAPTKNVDRFEWLVEKAIEIGVDEITPIICHFSERKTLRLDRLQKIAVSAMKQSLRAQLPKINDLTSFEKLVRAAAEPQKFIAWCSGEVAPPHLKNLLRAGEPALILIGPEGDFAEAEVLLAQKIGFQEVSLGAARLRTETAGLFAVSIANLAS